jgi:hypothetical protein
MILIIKIVVAYKSLIGLGQLAHCRFRRFPDSPTTGMRVLVRLGGEQDPSVDQAGDVGDSCLRGRLLGNQV